MAVKNPGFIDSAGSRNKRVNRFSAEGNRTRWRHRFTRDITLAFVAPDQITDTNSNLGEYTVGEFINAQGSVAQDGDYEIATVVAGQLDMVEQTIGAEAAGPDIMLVTRDNRLDARHA